MDVKTTSKPDDGKPMKLELPEPARPIHKDKRSLAIALVASVVFLVAALGIAVWLFLQKGGQAVIDQVDPNSTTNVLRTAWVAPELPSGYTAYDRSTPQASVKYYANYGEGCSLTTRVASDFDASDLEMAAVQTNDSEGIQTKTLAGDITTTVKDSDGQREYDFRGFELDRTVDVPTLDYKSESGVLYYRQFGNDLATIGFACKDLTLLVNSEELNELLDNFMVETER